MHRDICIFKVVEETEKIIQSQIMSLLYEDGKIQLRVLLS